MGRLLLQIVCLTIASIVLGQNCGNLAKNNCGNCVAEEGCGWCSPTLSCLPGDASGPTNSSCIGDSWTFGQCPPCEKYTDCDLCLEHSSDCIFCGNLNNGMGACKQIGFTGCSLQKTCSCSSYSTCGDCTNNPNCQYCESTGSCQPIGWANSTCEGPAFNGTYGCPCGLQQTCQDCHSSGCDWCDYGRCVDSQNGCEGEGNLAPNCMYYCESTAVDCEHCSELPGCGWCPQSLKCVDIATSPCAISSTCPLCQVASYCEECKSMPECKWCDDTGSCVAAASNNTCLSSMTCSSYCANQKSCSECNNALHRGCMWCEDKQTCGDLSDSSFCAFQSNCNAPVIGGGSKRHFDGPSFVGGMFLVIGTAALCVGLYVFYRWKTGKRLEYRAL